MSPLKKLPAAGIFRLASEYISPGREGRLMKDIEPLRSIRPHTLTLEGRQKAVLGGVEAVDSFNEQMVVLATTSGTLTLLGDGMHVSHLNLEEGQLIIEGVIAALEYDERSRGRASLFGRLFK